MSETQMQGTEVSRRDMLRTIAIAMTAAGTGTLGLEAGRHVHGLAQAEKEATGSYAPKFLNQHEYRTVQRLAELIIPADDHSGSAAEAGAGEFIDLLCSQNPALGAIYTGGILWLDHFSNQRSASRFLDNSPQQQDAVLATLSREAHRLEMSEKNRGPGFEFDERPEYQGFEEYTTQPRSKLGPGAQFFSWVRRMSADAFYTSPIGIQDVGFKGNSYWGRYRVPQEAIDYVMNLSPLKGQDD